MGVFGEQLIKYGYRKVYLGPAPWRVRVLMRLPVLVHLQWWHIGMLVLAGTAGGIYAVKRPLPTVLARVDGSAIVTADLDAEALAEGLAPETLDTLATKRVLARVIDRRLLVAAARQAGTDNNPAFQAMRARADEMVIASTVAQRFVGTPPVISDDAGRNYIAAHRAMFADRQTYAIDAIAIDLPQIPPAMLDKANSMADVVTMLNMLQLPVKRETQRLDSARLPLAIAASLATLAPGKVLVVNAGATAFIGTVIQRTPAAAAPDQQLLAARNALATQQADARVERALVALRAKAKISYTLGRPQ